MSTHLDVARRALQAEEAEILSRIDSEQRNLEGIRSALSSLNGSSAPVVSPANSAPLWSRNQTKEPAQLAPRLLAVLPRSGKPVKLQEILSKLYDIPYMDVEDSRYKVATASLSNLVKKGMVTHVSRGVYSLVVASDPAPPPSPTVTITKGKPRGQVILEMVRDEFGGQPVSSGMIYDSHKEYFDKQYPKLKKRFHKTNRINAVLSGLCSQRKLIRQDVGRYIWNPSQQQ